MWDKLRHLCRCSSRLSYKKINGFDINITADATNYFFRIGSTPYDNVTNKYGSLHVSVRKVTRIVSVLAIYVTMSTVT